jgi:polyketide cyclase/dehydrase/lipid transport protein
MSPVPESRATRGATLTFVRSIPVPRSVHDVFAYASDFNRAHEWRTEVDASSMRPAGPMRVGTELHEESVIAGRRVVTESVVDTYEPDHRFTFAHLSGPLPVSGEYAVAAAPSGSTLTYTLRVRLVGAWRLLAPVFRRTGGRTMERSLTRFAEQVASGASTRSGPVERP